ncbi:MAG: hypothetical protein ACKO7P_00165 [Bacteroidota bacterium]
MKVYRAYFFLILLILTACSKSNSSMLKGKLHDYTGLDGCGMLIDLDNGTTLEPTNLWNFQDDVNLVDGQKVWVKYSEISAGSICMVGKVVEIDELENR